MNLKLRLLSEVLTALLLLRYLALRWSTPTQRKRKVNKTKAAPPPPKSESDESTDGGLGSLIREGKNLAGFVICELDLLTGSLLLTLTTPWATGAFPVPQVLDVCSLCRN